MAKIHIHQKDGPKFYSEVFAKSKVDKKEEARKEKRQAKKLIEEKKARRIEKREWYKNNIKQPLLKKCDALFETEKIPSDAKKILEDFSSVVQAVLPLNSKQLQNLPHNINDLSHWLTDQRDERKTAYMNDKVVLSSYIRYFMWWNLVRQTRLFANMDVQALNLADDDICLDIGSGPLTVVIALWLSCPSLRSKKLTWYCLDLSPLTLSFGEELYLSIASRTISENQSPWKIIRVKGAMGVSIKQKAKFITCSNMFNEVFQSETRPLDFLAKNYTRQLMSYGTQDASYLVVEPGVPRSARFVSLTRDCFIRNGFTISGPCPHAGTCPMDGRLLKGERDDRVKGNASGTQEGKNGKWCNFAFGTTDAPEKLLKLSQSSHLPKERAVLSYVLAVSGVKAENPDAQVKNENLKLRIASDAIKLPDGRTGFYACSGCGLALVIRRDKQVINSGDLFETDFIPTDNSPRDKKTGAFIV